jgi:hypothetical protein
VVKNQEFALAMNQGRSSHAGLERRARTEGCLRSMAHRTPTPPMQSERRVRSSAISRGALSPFYGPRRISWRSWSHPKAGLENTRVLPLSTGDMRHWRKRRGLSGSRSRLAEHRRGGSRSHRRRPRARRDAPSDGRRAVLGDGWLRLMVAVPVGRGRALFARDRVRADVQRSRPISTRAAGSTRSA